MNALPDFMAYRANYSKPEIDAILARPELQPDGVQKELLTILQQPGSPASLRRAFETQCALHIVPVVAEAATDVHHGQAGLQPEQGHELGQVLESGSQAAPGGSTSSAELPEQHQVDQLHEHGTD
jgi:hypothetical protein